MKELKEITGEVQNAREKAVAINNEWYSGFNEISNVSKGEVITIKFSDNTKNGKIFHNIQEIIKPTSETKISDSTVNTLIMTVKEIAIAYINQKSNINLQDIASEVVKSYKSIKSNI